MMHRSLLRVAVYASLAAIFVGCSDRATVSGSKRILSPDAEWEAVSEHVDANHGSGMRFHEVHLHALDSAAANHGDRHRSMIFYVESEQRGSERPIVEWLDSRRLRVTYSSTQRPAKMITKLADVEIEYAASALPLSCTESVL